MCGSSPNAAVGRVGRGGSATRSINVHSMIRASELIAIDGDKKTQPTWRVPVKDTQESLEYLPALHTARMMLRSLRAGRSSLRAVRMASSRATRGAAEKNALPNAKLGVAAAGIALGFGAYSTTAAPAPALCAAEVSVHAALSCGCVTAAMRACARACAKNA